MMMEGAKRPVIATIAEKPHYSMARDEVACMNLRLSKNGVRCDTRVMEVPVVRIPRNVAAYRCRQLPIDEPANLTTLEAWDPEERIVEQRETCWPTILRC